jgi:hypothetical protein
MTKIETIGDEAVTNLYCAVTVNEMIIDYPPQINFITCSLEFSSDLIIDPTMPDFGAPLSVYVQQAAACKVVR